MIGFTINLSNCISLKALLMKSNVPINLEGWADTLCKMTLIQLDNPNYYLLALRILTKDL